MIYHIHKDISLILHIHINMYTNNSYLHTLAQIDLYIGLNT